MTAFKFEDSSSDKAPGMKHKCLRRKSQRTYELLDPTRSEEVIAFDIGQIKAIVEMDRRLRVDGVIASVPAGYSQFAARFNEYATGPERFATFSYVRGNPEICKAGSPIVWEHFLIDESLVGSHSDLCSHETVARSSHLPGVTHHGVQTSTPDSVGGGKVELPQVRALSGYMKGALQTTDQLIQFWIKRGAIEHEYASRLAKLAEKPIGEKEPSEFRDAIDGFRVEAARQAMNHNTLAMQIAVELETRCVKLQLDQEAHFREVYEPAVKKLEGTQVQKRTPQAGISFEWKKEYRNVRHSLDLTRLQTMKDFHSPFSSKPPSSADDFDLNLGRTVDPVWGSPSRRKEWETLFHSCQKMETDRSQFMKDLLSSFTDVLSSVRGSHNESYGTIVRTLDLFRPEEVLEEFNRNFKADTKSKSSLSFRNPSSSAFSKNPGQDFTQLQSEMLSPRPLPQPPTSTVQTTPSLFYLKIAGKETQSPLDLRSGDVVEVSASPDGGLWEGKLLSRDNSNFRNGAVPLRLGTRPNEETTTTGSRPLPTKTNRLNASTLKSSPLRSTSFTSRGARPSPSGARRHSQHPDALPKRNLPLPQELTSSQRRFRPNLPTLNTWFGERPIQTNW